MRAAHSPQPRAMAATIDNSRPYAKAAAAYNCQRQQVATATLMMTAVTMVRMLVTRARLQQHFTHACTISCQRSACFADVGDVGEQVVDQFHLYDQDRVYQHTRVHAHSQIYITDSRRLSISILLVQIN